MECMKPLLINDWAIAHLYGPNGANNNSVKLEPGTTEGNQTYCKVYMWSILNCNREFLGKDCSSAKIATCLGVWSYTWRTSLVKIGMSI